jgi:hypothetical protein
MSKHVHIFSIGRNYRTAQVFTADARTMQRVGTSTLTLNPGLARKTRFAEIVTWLRDFKLVPPPYVPTKREVGQ